MNTTTLRKNKIKESPFDQAIHAASVVMLIALVILVAVPVLNYFSLAFNDSTFNSSITIFPSKWSFAAFEYIFSGQYQGFWKSVWNSVVITAVVTIVSNLVEALVAYPLSKKDCPCREGILLFFIITMLFSAGVVPIYLLMKDLNLLDNIWSIILCSISNVANLLFFKTFFEGLPKEIEEAAVIDGASSLQLFFRIIVPMSLPVFASCCFFTIVGMWNGYGGALIFIKTSATDQMPLAYFLYTKMATTDSQAMYDTFLRDNKANIEAASMLISIIPILCIYPFVIKYIKSGATLGSVKG